MGEEEREAEREEDRWRVGVDIKGVENERCYGKKPVYVKLQREIPGIWDNSTPSRQANTQPQWNEPLAHRNRLSKTEPH